MLFKSWFCRNNVQCVFTNGSLCLLLIVTTLMFSERSTKLIAEIILFLKGFSYFVGLSLAVSLLPCLILARGLHNNPGMAAFFPFIWRKIMIFVPFHHPKKFLSKSVEIFIFLKSLNFWHNTLTRQYAWVDALQYVFFFVCNILWQRNS